MAGSVNKVILVGNLGKDPEIRTAQDGTKIVNFSLATSETWNDRGSGERKERTEWHRVVVFNENIAGVVEKYVRKGHKIYVEGALQTRKWTDQSGQEKYTTEVVIGRFNGNLTMLGGGRDGEGDAGGGGGGYAARERAPARGAAPASAGRGGERGGESASWEPPRPGGSDLDDEIPF